MGGAAITFWIFALALAGLAALMLLVALLRGRGEAGVATASDLDVYRDQLREVEKDVARGLLSDAEAERVRVEISRRVLEADRTLAGAGEAGGAPRWLSLVAAATAALVVVGGAALIYARIGAPGSPDQPLRARIAMAEERRALRPSQAEAEQRLGPPELRQDVDPSYLQLIEQLRGVVAERPNDAQGLALLARHEAALGNFPAAHAAQAVLIEVKGADATAQDFTNLAEMLILAAGGYVSPESEAALIQALGSNPRHPVARYYSGLLFVQIDRPDLAFRFWQALLAEGPPEAPWIPPIRMQIEEIAYRAGQHNYVLPPVEDLPGPSADDIEAAGQMTEEERTEMIRGMVGGLAERLATEGGPASDWARLIRAYGVLGEAETAAAVLEEARAVFADDPVGLAEIEAAASDAGLAP
jgi:cytochrome c-type biogenesis protein CcmH